MTSLTGGIHLGQQAYSQATSISDMELKELYAQNVLGYTKDEEGTWRDESGKKVKEKEIRKIDLDDATDAYNSGEYITKESSKNIATTLSNSKETSANKGFGADSQDYIAEAVLAYKSGDTDYDWSALTDEEKEQAREQIAADFNANGKKFSDDDQRQVAINMGNHSYDESKRKKADSERFEEALESEAKSVGASTDALRLYTLAQEKASKSSKNLTAATAKNAAASYKFNKTYNEGRKTFEDSKDAWNTYIKALKDGEEISYDVADAAGEIVGSLREMGINLSNEQLQNPEALEHINKLFSGTEEEAKKAYEVLRDMS